MISINMAQEMLEEICRLCRKLNPQHADCNSCQGTEAWREAIKDPTDAPDLLTVLKDMTDFLEGNGPWDEPNMYILQAREVIAKHKGATEDATEPAIRTQAHLMQEWGQERFATALSALANWYQQLGHADPFSTQEIEALQDANDDAFQFFSATALYRDSKPPPDWSTNVKIAIEDVLKWELYKEIVSSAIVDHAGAIANVPEKYRDCWMATAIEITGHYFTVKLDAWDRDI